MRILGIDYGRAKIGLAVAENGFSEPLKVVRVNSFDDAVKKVLQVLQVEQVDKVVIGISEGKMSEETKKFVLAIQPFIHSTISLSDETLTSQDAQRMSREAGISRKKRHGMEDAYAASIMLQNWLDSKKES